MQRGTVVESGLNMWLNGTDQKEAMDKMIDEYDNNCSGLANEKVASERENLVPLFNEGVERLKEYAFKWDLVGYQKKVEMDIHGIPLVGYTDFQFEDKSSKESFYIDLKTTLRKPHGISNSHAMQQAIYQKGTNANQKLWYLVCKKSGTEFYEFSLEDYKKPMQICEHIVKVMGNWLSKVDSLDDVKNILLGIGGSGPTKRIPPKIFIEFMNLCLNNFNCRFFLATGNKNEEIEIMNEILSYHKNLCTPLNELSISETLPIIKNCNIAVCNDSSFSHLSAGLGKPTIVLMSDTPLIYGSYSSKMHPLIPDGVENVTHGTEGKERINPLKIFEKFQILIS